MWKKLCPKNGQLDVMVRGTKVKNKQLKTVREVRLPLRNQVDTKQFTLSNTAGIKSTLPLLSLNTVYSGIQ